MLGSIVTSYLHNFLCQDSSNHCAHWGHLGEAVPRKTGQVKCSPGEQESRRDIWKSSERALLNRNTSYQKEPIQSTALARQLRVEAKSGPWGVNGWERPLNSGKQEFFHTHFGFFKLS